MPPASLSSSGSNVLRRIEASRLFQGAVIALLMFIIFYIYGAIGSMFFADVDEYLWGDVAASMLTLFRVATFEDWTDVMYATMEPYPLSWLYYLTFIFLTAFVFLNLSGGNEGAQ